MMLALPDLVKRNASQYSVLDATNDDLRECTDMLSTSRSPPLFGDQLLYRVQHAFGDIAPDGYTCYHPR